MVIKRYSANRDFAHLSVLVQYPWMCSVQGSMGEGECSNSHLDTRRSLSRATIIRKEMT